jgi:hypothetical protein
LISSHQDRHLPHACMKHEYVEKRSPHHLLVGRS